MNNANYNSREYSNLDGPHDDDGDDNDRSPIDLRITTTVQVMGDNNAILLTALPAEHAKAIAEAVTATVREAAGTYGGIPMIDEEGRPRPFKISVAAGMYIEGAGNVLGNADHIMQSLGKRKRDESEGDGDGEAAVAAKGSDGTASPPPPRRSRRSSC